MQLQQGPTFPVTQKPPNFKTASRQNGYKLGARIEVGFLNVREVYIAALIFENKTLRTQSGHFFLNGP
jgi:hypothetical protein